MDKISFKKQTGCYSPYLVVETSDSSIAAMLYAIANEASLSGRALELKTVDYNSVGEAFVKSMTFGVGDDIKKSGIIGDTAFPLFFSEGRLYEFLILTNNSDNACQVSGGTTIGGFELFTGKAVPASGSVAILISYPADAAAPFFIHAGGEGDTWNDASLTIKTVSDPI